MNTKLIPPVCVGFFSEYGLLLNVRPSAVIISSVMLQRQLGCTGIEEMSSSLSYILSLRDTHSSQVLSPSSLCQRRPAAEYIAEQIPDVEIVHL